MAARLFPFARAIVDFAVTDTWDPAGTDYRKDEWIGAVYYDYDATDGYLVYRCVKNTSAASIPANRLVFTDIGETNIDHVEKGTGVTTPVSRTRGMTIGAIAAGECGFVVCRGKVTGEAVGSNVTADTAITQDSAGLIKDGTVGTHAIIGSSFALINVGVLATGKVFIDVL